MSISDVGSMPVGDRCVCATLLPLKMGDSWKHKQLHGCCEYLDSILCGRSWELDETCLRACVFLDGFREWLVGELGVHPIIFFLDSVLRLIRLAECPCFDEERCVFYESNARSELVMSCILRSKKLVKHNV